MKNLLRIRPELWGLTIAALLTRLWMLFSPHAVVFDEVYFKTYAGDYLTGSYYFDPHPPLGKLLLGGWAWLTQQSGTLLTGSDPGVLLRLLPALAGVLIVPVFYCFLLQLRASRRVAFLGALLLLLDNALLVESRFILMDSLLILFGLTAVTLYLAARKRQGRAYYWYLAGSVIFAGLTASIKLTGLAILAIILIAWFIDAVRHPAPLIKLPRLSQLAMLIGIPLAVYAATFWIHFRLLPNTGQGDAFMTQKFQATLKGNANYDHNTRMSFGQKFIELNKQMQASEESLKTATHPYGSKWYTWPFMIRPVYYWQGDAQTSSHQGNIYLLGNPFVWWGSLLGIFIVIGAWLRRNRSLHPYSASLGFLLVCYLLNYLPFSAIVRVMFLYHYFLALCFGIAFAAIGIGALAGWMGHDKQFWHFPNPASRNLYLGIIVIACAGFLYFSPLSYGWPLSPQELMQHMWLRSWR